MKRKLSKKLLAGAIAALVVGTASVGTTIAWLTSQQSIVNTFSPGKLTGTVEEDFNNQVKTNVSVTNSGDVDAYIRVALVPNWMDGESIAALETMGTYELALHPNSGWFLSNGYYYYSEKVAGGDKTEVLIDSCKPTANDGAYSGKQFRLDVVAQLIQANPNDAVESAWTDVSVVDGLLTNKK